MPRTTSNIYFTSWQYIRPGGFGWVDKDGNSLPTGGEKGDLHARFVNGSPSELRLVAQPCREKIALRDDQFPTMLIEDGKHKCWYTPMVRDWTKPIHGQPPGHNHYLHYAESDDGEHWVTPKLGIHEVDGSRDNNVVFRGDLGGSVRGLHGQSVFLDPHGPASERYRMVYLGKLSVEETKAYLAKWPRDVDPMALHKDGWAWGLCGAVSPDGLHWTTRPEPLLIQHADTLNRCEWDTRLGKYVAYYRHWQIDYTEAEQNPGGLGRRAIGRAFSEDFVHFHTPHTFIAAGANYRACDVWYGPGKARLPMNRDPHGVQQIAFPFLWKLDEDSFDVHLYSSPDSWVWSPVPGSPLPGVITPGTPGSWDGGYLAPTGDMFERSNGDWALPIHAYPIPHKYPRNDPAKRWLYPGVLDHDGYALWDHERLVALEAHAEAEFMTVGIKPSGGGGGGRQRMRINASIRPSGYIRIGLQTFFDYEKLKHHDIEGRLTADCDPITGDGHDLAVTWRGGESDMKWTGEGVILRVQMRQARLFGIEFHD